MTAPVQRMSWWLRALDRFLWPTDTLGQAGLVPEPDEAPWTEARTDRAARLDALEPPEPATRLILDNARVLLVDDDLPTLQGLDLALQGSCIVHLASDPQTALELVAELPDLAVVITDLRMPGMDGITFLRRLKELAPEAVRVLLTGHMGVDAAIGAINDGSVFRILTKPCPLETLQSCLQDAIAHHQLITAERELLTKTLRGSVRALVETLSLANPLAFSRAERIRNRVVSLLDELDDEGTWDIEMAAMLSQLGAVTLPPTVTESLHEGRRVSPHLQELVDRIPALSADLLNGIPRLEGVRDNILYQDQRFDGRGMVSARMKGAQIPLGARLLRIATDYDTLEARGTRVRPALTELRSQRGRYDPEILDALEHVVTVDAETEAPIDQIRLEDLRSGMVLAADIVAEGDVMLCGRGQEVTQRTIDRVKNWAKQYHIIQPIEVFYGPSSDA